MGKFNETIEQRVGRAILQQGDNITVGGKSYKVAPPSVATLILASEAISRLPQVHLDNGKVIEESLSIAKECRIIGDVIAILILGAKRGGGSRLFAFRRRRLARRLLENLTPSELHKLTAVLLKDMQIGDFFGLTTFLTEINLMRPTKVVEQTASETTAFGQ